MYYSRIFVCRFENPVFEFDHDFAKTKCFKKNHARHVRNIYFITHWHFKQCCKTCDRSVFDTCHQQIQHSKQCNNFIIWYAYAICYNFCRQCCNWKITIQIHPQKSLAINDCSTIIIFDQFIYSIVTPHYLFVGQ